jgi:hypothetical protein
MKISPEVYVLYLFSFFYTVTISQVTNSSLCTRNGVSCSADIIICCQFAEVLVQHFQFSCRQTISQETNSPLCTRNSVSCSADIIICCQFAEVLVQHFQFS